MKIMYWFLIIFLCLCAANSKSSGRIEYLPGFEGPLPFQLETGYVGVGVNEEVQLFYYFIRSESNPSDDPLMLWLTGGPGCSSISGVLYQFGPLQFEAVSYNGSLPTLILRHDSWTKMANIIFLDNPVGTGFSYAMTDRASHSTIHSASKDASDFMRKWLERYPEYKANPFYVGGDSYSGLIVPMVTQLISNGNEASTKPYINLKGYVLGNPLTFYGETNYKIRFANGMGLISDEHYKSLLHDCHGEYRSDYIDSNNLKCTQNLELFEKCIDGILLTHILKPNCDTNESRLEQPIRMWTDKHLGVSAFYCQGEGYELAYFWANDARVREALHIREGSTGEWQRCHLNKDLDFTTTLNDIRPYHANLSNKGYRSLVFSGDHDMMVPHQSTHAWIKELNYSVIDHWRPWKVHAQIAGYTESFSNGMTFATVKGGGHTAPDYRPAECFMMFKRWISHQQL